jgi:hypothetical protein
MYPIPEILRRLSTLEGEQRSAGSAGVTLPSWTTNAWFIDGSNSTGHASDANDGLTSATPLRTWAGLIAKWGTDGPRLAPTSGTVTITFLSDMEAGDEIIFRGTLLKSSMVLTSPLTPLAAGVGPTAIGAVTARDQTAALPAGLLTPIFNAPAPPAMLIENMTAAKSSRALCFQSVAGNEAQPRMLQPHTIIPPTATIVFGSSEVNTWAGGDTVVSYQLPKVVLGAFEALGSANNAGSTANVVYFVALHWFDPSGLPGMSTFAPTYYDGNVQIVDCWIEPFGFIYEGVSLFGSFLAGGGVMLGEQSFLYGGCQGSQLFIYGNFCEVGGDAYFDAGVFGRANCSLGAIGCNSTKQIDLRGGRFELITDDAGAGPLLWGQCTTLVEGSGCCILTTGTWVAAVPHVTLSLDGIATGSSYTPGTGAWASGIALSAANLDAYAGLQNPITGSRFCTVP